MQSKIRRIEVKRLRPSRQFFVDFEKAVNKFKPSSGKIKETGKMRYLIQALPLSCSHIGDFIDIIPEEQRTVEYVKSKIKEKNLTKKECDKRSTMSTFTAKFEGKCHAYAKTGHKQKDCWSQRNQNGSQQSSSRGRGSQRGHFNYNHCGYSRGNEANTETTRTSINQQQRRRERGPSES